MSESIGDGDVECQGCTTSQFLQPVIQTKADAEATMRRREFIGALGAAAAWPPSVARASAQSHNKTMARRINPDHCFGVIIDAQELFLSRIAKRARSRIQINTGNFARLLGYFKIPIVVTLERSVEQKGSLPKEISQHLSNTAEMFEKDFFDLTKEQTISDRLGQLNRKQVIVAGCETDVCVLQSCLGLLGLGFEVYLVEELLFSSSRNVDSAVARMQAEGAVVLSYKSLYYELTETVNDDDEEGLAAFGPFPVDLPDSAI
jgi:isochorismatase family protein